MKLLSSVKKNNKILFKNYVIEYKSSFYKIAYSYVKNQDDALDIVQESILKGLSKIDKIEDIDSIKSWFYKILINTSIDYIRKNKKYTYLEDQLSIPSPSGHDIDTDIDIQRGLDDLPQVYKTVIILRYFEDMKISDIANILDENLSTVKTRLYTALKLLKIKIEDEGAYYEQ